MAINIKKTGGAKEAGLAAGVGKALEITSQEQRQEEARNIAMEWEAKKLIYADQQDFVHQTRMKQAELDKEARAQEWEVEKLELISKSNFAAKEQARLERYNQFTNTIKYVNDLEQSGNYSEEQLESMRVRAARPYERDGFDEVAEILGARDIDDFGVKPGYFEYLKDEDRQLAAEIQAGIAPRVSRPDTVIDQREKLEALVGPEVAKFMSMKDLEMEVRKLGIDPDAILGEANQFTGGVDKPPTPEELRSANTKESYELGKKLGYWN